MDMGNSVSALNCFVGLFCGFWLMVGAAIWWLIARWWGNDSDEPFSLWNKESPEDVRARENWALLSSIENEEDARR